MFAKKGLSPRAHLLCRLIFLLGAAYLAKPAAAQISETSRALSFCEGVIAYAANAAMLAERPNTARVLLLQAGRNLAANFSLNYDGSKIPASHTEAMRAARRSSKPYLDAAPHLLDSELTRCVELTNRVFIEQQSVGARLFGRTLIEAADEAARAARESLGLE